MTEGYSHKAAHIVEHIILAIALDLGWRLHSHMDANGYVASHREREIR